MCSLDLAASELQMDGSNVIRVRPIRLSVVAGKDLVLCSAVFPSMQRVESGVDAH